MQARRATIDSSDVVSTSKQARQCADARKSQAEEAQNAQDKSNERKHGLLLPFIWNICIPLIILCVMPHDKNGSIEGNLDHLQARGAMIEAWLESPSPQPAEN